VAVPFRITAPMLQSRMQRLGISAVPDADISASADMSAERLRHRLVSLANTHSDQSVKPCSVQRLG